MRKEKNRHPKKRLQGDFAAHAGLTHDEIVLYVRFLARQAAEADYNSLLKNQQAKANHGRKRGVRHD
jgi:hypothetical protein